MHILPWFVYNRIFQLTFFVVMYRYGAMVINLTRRGYCDAGLCMSVLTVCGCVFVYLCVRSPISQYNFVKCGTIVTTLYIETTGYICWIPGEAFWKYTGGGLHWHIKKGVLITGTIRNRRGGLRTILSQEQLLHTSADISRFPIDDT